MCKCANVQMCKCANVQMCKCVKAQKKDEFVTESTLSRILKGQSGITPEMSLRLSKALGRSPDTWLTMQSNYDLWQAKKRVNLRNVHAVSFKAGD
jgi:addiction module HigA family antidote